MVDRASAGCGALVLLLALTPACVAAHDRVAAAATAAAASPYAVTRRVGAWVFVSGQIPRDPATGQWRHGGDIDRQTRLVLDNLKAALAGEGVGLADVVKTTVLLRSATDMAAMNAVYQRYFTQQPLPVRTTIPGVDFGTAPILIEIDAIAFVGEPEQPTSP